MCRGPWRATVHVVAGVGHNWSNWSWTHKPLKPVNFIFQVCIWFFNILNIPCLILLSLQFSSIAQSCLTLWDPMDYSMPGLPVHHQLPEFTQTHLHWVSDAIQPPHPLSSPPPSIFPSIRVFSNESALHIRWPKYWSFTSTSVLTTNTQDWSPLGWTGWISLQSKGLSRVFSNTTVQKHQFFQCFLYGPTLISINDYWKNHSFDYH